MRASRNIFSVVSAVSIGASALVAITLQSCGLKSNSSHDNPAPAPSVAGNKPSNGDTGVRIPNGPAGTQCYPSTNAPSPSNQPFGNGTYNPNGNTEYPNGNTEYPSGYNNPDAGNGPDYPYNPDNSNDPYSPYNPDYSNDPNGYDPQNNPYDNGPGYPNDPNNGPYDNGPGYPYNPNGPQYFGTGPMGNLRSTSTLPVFPTIPGITSPNGTGTAGRPVLNSAPGSNCQTNVGPTAAVTPRLTYSLVAPIITANCATSSCHGVGARNPLILKDQAAVDANKAAIYSAVSSGSMPLYRQLSAADRQALLNYTQQP